MARSLIPDPLARRHELERKLEPARARAIAAAYRAAGRDLESIAFLRIAGATEELESIWSSAVADGDAFLLREVSAALGREPDLETWRSLATAADAAGRARPARPGPPAQGRGPVRRGARMLRPEASPVPSAPRGRASDAFRW